MSVRTVCTQRISFKSIIIVAWICRLN